MSLNKLKASLMIGVLLGSTSAIWGGCSLRLADPKVGPIPLSFPGEGTASIIIGENRKEAIPALTIKGDPTCIFKVEFNAIELTEEDTSLIKGKINDYFYIEYDSVLKQLKFTQKEKIPALEELLIEMPVTVTETTAQSTPLNGFIVNIRGSIDKASRYVYSNKVTP